MEYLLPYPHNSNSNYCVRSIILRPILSFQYTYTHMRFHLSITSHFHSSQHGEFSQSIEDIYLSDSSRASEFRLHRQGDAEARVANSDFDQKANERFTYCFPPALLPHYRYADEVRAFLLSRADSQFNSRPFSFSLSPLVITSPPPSSLFLPRSMFRSRCRVLRPSTLVVSNCARERFRVAAVSTETFNREWNSRWNVNETQLDYTTTTLFLGYSQSFAEIPGCFQRDEIPAWQTQRRFPPRSRTTNPNLSHVIFLLLFFPPFSLPLPSPPSTFPIYLRNTRTLVL